MSAIKRAWVHMPELAKLRHPRHNIHVDGGIALPTLVGQYAATPAVMAAIGAASIVLYFL